jgi:hypothetical protein
MGAFATVFPNLFTRIKLPHASIGGLPIYAIRMRSGSPFLRRSVLIVGGLHARELMNPDAIVDLMVDLCIAYQNGTDLTYGNRTWTAAEIKSLVETLDIWMIPCANPDGRQRVIDGDDLWRKNVRDNPNTSCEGVDVNRNFDIAWGITTGKTSCKACDVTYCGEATFSEPESMNVRDFCNAHNINVYVDVHSYTEVVLYPWGHAPTQVTDPSQVFMTLATGTCMPLSPPDYREHMSRRDLRRFQTVSQRVVDSVKAVRGRVYRAITPYTLYPLDKGATGTSADYMYSRHIANPSLQKTYGFALETGPDTGNAEESFHPDDPMALSAIKRDAKAAILTLIEQSTCAIEFIGASLIDAPNIVEEVRSVRDQTLSTTPPGLEWIELFERIQGQVLSQILSDENLSKEAASLLKRGGTLLRSDSARLTERDLARARVFLQLLAKRLPPDVRTDIDEIQVRLASAKGQTGSQIIAALTEEGPRGRKPRKDRPAG